MRSALPYFFAIGVLTGCKGPEIPPLKDSEGRTYKATCEPERGCQIEQASGPAWPGRPLSVLHTETRIIAACSVKEDRAVEAAGDCRALVCNTDADCPPAHGLPHGTCLAGLCTDQSHAFVPDDAVILCLFGMGLGRDGTAQLERTVMAKNCGSPCETPKVCRQP